ncbi:la-related protein 6-like [Trichomycterus rosablanca]|uniref:la-related protein 6-like n=1 Tax=Trichomycterus rosablanca TaxID=2290929 RepID=UPI002F3575CA
MRAEDTMKSITTEYKYGEDLDLDSWTPPDADLIKKMVSQIEYYLSDENLAKDAFLLKHVRRNKMGYINIKLLTSFKKIKHMTKDWRVTAYALRYSLKLEVNEEGTKVRRLNPVPESVLFHVASKLLLVWNVPDTNQTEDMSPRKSTMEAALAILEPFGTIAMARVNRPGRELPPELQKYSYRYPELFTEESVLVEYEDLEGAGRAYHQLSQSDGNMRVLLVGKPSKKKPTKVGSEDRSNEKSISILNRRMSQLQACGDDSSACSSSESEFTSSLPLVNVRQFSSAQVCSPSSSPRSCPRLACSPLPGRRMSPLLASEIWGSPDTSPELRRRNLDRSSDRPQRRKLASKPKLKSALEETKLNKIVPKGTLNGETLPQGVLRLPYGPDGSKGFQVIIARRRLCCSLHK